MQCGSQLGHAAGKFGVVGDDVLAAEKGWRIRRTAGCTNQPLRQVHNNSPDWKWPILLVAATDLPRANNVAGLACQTTLGGSFEPQRLSAAVSNLSRAVWAVQVTN